MAVILGLVLDGDRALSEILSPLAPEVSRCYWVVDAQSGPFDPAWLYASPENEALAERLRWDVPALAGTSTFGLLSGTLPRLADRLLVDEWSYYYAICAPEEDQASPKAVRLARDIGNLSEPFLRRLDELADLFACHVDGWWELYTGRPDWHARLRRAWPECRERPVSRAGDPPQGGGRFPPAALRGLPAARPAIAGCASRR